MNVGGEVKDDSTKKREIDYCYEELSKYIAKQEAVTTKIRFDDLQDYKNTLSSLIIEEAEYEQKMAEIQETYDILFTCTVISYEKRKIMLSFGLENSKVYLKCGDFVGIRQKGYSTEVSMGRVVDIEERNQKIYIDIHLGNAIPTEFWPCYVDLMWCCVPFTRMMTSLRNFTRTGSYDKTDLKNYILGTEIPGKHFEVRIPDNFHVPGLPNLNKAQIETITNSLEKRVSLIQGPPGTGKTVTIAAIVYYLVKYLKKKVLVCASSNKAVDNAYKKITDTGIKVVRVIAKYRQDGEDSLEENTSISNNQASSAAVSETIQLQEIKTVEKSQNNYVVSHLNNLATEKQKSNGNIMGRENNVSSDLYLNKGNGSSSVAKLSSEIKDLCENLDLCGFAPPSQTRHSETSDQYRYSNNTGSQNVNSKLSSSPVIQPKTTTLNNQRKGYFNGDPAPNKIGIKKDLSVIEAEAVCATCCGAGDPRVCGIRFDCVLIDESTQSTEPESLIPISLCGERLIMVGDHRQLGPVVKCKSASEKGLSLSLFDRLIKIGSIPYLLNEQYRMHPGLSEFSSLAFYQGSIKNGVTIVDRTDQNISFKWPVKDKPTFFYCSYGIEQPSSSGTSFFNQKEADAVKMFVKNLIDSGLKGSQIGVITPYDGQRSKIVDLILRRNRNKVGENPYSGIEVANVHPFQGREKDYIIISCVRSNYNNSIGFLRDTRILNVAITRARFGLIIVGNPYVLSRNCLWKTLIVYYRDKNLIFEGPLDNLKPANLIAEKMFKESKTSQNKKVNYF